DPMGELFDLAFADQRRRAEERPVSLPPPDGALLLENAQSFADGPAADIDLRRELAFGGEAAAVPVGGGKVPPQCLERAIARGFRCHNAACPVIRPGTITHNWFQSIRRDRPVKEAEGVMVWRLPLPIAAINLLLVVVRSPDGLKRARITWLRRASGHAPASS